MSKLDFYISKPDTCYQCGKRFSRTPQHVYKDYVKTGKSAKLRYFCTWGCLQKYRRREQHGERGKEEYVENEIRNHIKLDMDKAREIRKLYAAGAGTQEEIAGKYGVSIKTVSNIITGRAWKE